MNFKTYSFIIGLFVCIVAVADASSKKPRFERPVSLLKTSLDRVMTAGTTLSLKKGLKVLKHQDHLYFVRNTYYDKAPKIGPAYCKLWALEVSEQDRAFPQGMSFTVHKTKRVNLSRESASCRYPSCHTIGLPHQSYAVDIEFEDHSHAWGLTCYSYSKYSWNNALPYPKYPTYEDFLKELSDYFSVEFAAPVEETLAKNPHNS